MIKISNICLHQNSIVIKFLKILKIREFFCENPRIIFVLFYDVHKEHMFIINLEDGREAPSNASIVYCIYGYIFILILQGGIYYYKNNYDAYNPINVLLYIINTIDNIFVYMET